MASVPGTKVKVAAFTETTYKTIAGTPAGQLLYFKTFGLKPTQPRAESQMLSGLRGRTRSALQQKSVAGPITAELGPESIGFYLKHLVGTPTSAVEGAAYKHTFEVGDGVKAIPPGITFEPDFTSAIATAGRYITYKGNKLGQGSFTFTPQGFIEAAFDVLGADWDASGVAPLDATLTDTGHTSFSAANVTVALSSGGALDVCFQQLAFTWNNGLDETEYCISGGGVRDALDEGLITLTGSTTSLFDTAALLNKVLADADCALVITILRGTGAGTAGNEKLVITIPSLAFEITAPAVEGPKGVVMQAAFSAHRTSGEIGAKFELYNAQSTIA